MDKIETTQLVQLLANELQCISQNDAAEAQGMMHALVADRPCVYSTKHEVQLCYEKGFMAAKKLLYGSESS